MTHHKMAHPYRSSPEKCAILFQIHVYLFHTFCHRSDLIPVRMKDSLCKRHCWKGLNTQLIPFLVSFNGQTHSYKNTPSKADMAEAFRNQKKILNNQDFIFVTRFTDEFLEPLIQFLVVARMSQETSELK